MRDVEYSPKGLQLIEMYKVMAETGYDRIDQRRIDDAFSDFELRAYRPQVAEIFKIFSISSVLDYGCGGSDWFTPGFHEETQQSAIQYFGLGDVYRFEPARGIDERQAVDCVVSFDVLEHVFITDVPAVLRNMFSYANKLLLLNVACYYAGAKLPNGENAHVTVRNPVWWKGMVDCISTEFPHVSVCLLCSTSWRNSSMFDIWSAGKWQEGTTFVTAG